MGRIYGYYEWDETVGNPGHRIDGSLHQNLYNEDRVLSGHARFVPDEDRLNPADEYSYENTFVTSDHRRESEESNELAEVIGELIVAVTVAGIAKAAPHVKQWWQETARPAVNRQAKWIRSIGRKKKSDEPETQVLNPARDEHAAIELDQRQIMSRQEAMARIIAGLAAKAYSDEQLRMVKSARIVEVEDYAEIEQALSQIPSEQLQALIIEMVKNPALLEDGSLANLASMLNPSNQHLGLSPEPIHREDPKI
ncbi:hypothetical protein [Arcanobacterium hippocoleae]|uniref:Uncharacterized protein n=1 Tax=Arcanobacterium hippocoleae TaxID=149017 RepID=A0ABU1SZJ5_9ACTO|nr:hypothetical protein [Arcanobacterium hippocoleae]MDR6938473.1 hypothetical protein [Arcanobacterium hippocoleae]MDR6940165.1 hypothetical protein [Arcanobacterium hippocoleae]